MPLIVRLDAPEVAVGRVVGQMRFDQAVAEKRRDGFRSHSVENHVLGALGEMAFAKGFGVYWDFSCGTFKRRRDVCGCEIRTRRGDDKPLVIRETDNATDLFALVCYREKSDDFRIAGFAIARDVQKPEWWNDKGPIPAFYLPQSELRGFRDFAVDELHRLPLHLRAEFGA